MSIHTIASVDDDFLETDVCSTSSGVDAGDHHEYIGDHFVWDSPNSLVIWHKILNDSSSTAGIMASSLIGVHSPLLICVDKCCMCYTLCLMEMLL
jgi:hypothetical protein